MEKISDQESQQQLNSDQETQINSQLDNQDAQSVDSDLPYVTDRSQIKSDLKPVCPQKKSYKVQLKHGETYFYCTCGLSKTQPFCDGSHVQMPGYKPLKFTYEGEDKIKGLCGCKYNKIEKGPFCDGQHKKLDW
ncbi:glutamate synthase [Stylonychia lemnae]|uniref:Glutamate synthase n=1 Tax=Stylonychia lemnae TaxID=5949 RepID=A0A078ADP1_STYLE|nr:glutamate synthase [Stylonychia lemnae]|eukprot:CDW80344.1 glutamate synthase [Stylonychia lemnae]